MNCRDFREIADSYLSDELLVETNHEVIRHLEHCANCRQELAARRNLREHLRCAVKNSAQSQISPVFAAKLKSDLRSDAIRKETRNWRKIFVSREVFAGAVAVFVLILGVGIARQYLWREPVQIADVNPKTPVPANIIKENEESSLQLQEAAFIKIKQTAVDDHKYCALEFSLKEMPITLEEAAKKFEKFNKDIDLATIKPLLEIFGDKVKLIEAHSCIIHGRRFAHVVLSYQNRTVSVLVTKREDESFDSKNVEVISCQSADGFQIACFATEKQSIFVVSDLAEMDNLKLARALAPSLKQHIERGGQDA